MSPRERIILPLDVTDLKQAQQLIDELGPYVGAFKVGYELGYSAGWQASINLITKAGYRAFADAKLDDIPRTVAAGVKALSQWDSWVIDVHASAGTEAMRQAVANRGNARILAVTVLTSISEAECQHIFGTSPGQKVGELALDILEAGIDGIICSPQELVFLNDPKFSKLLKVIPGVRPDWSDQNDQQRTMTPAEAVRAGADYLVIGRPILKPPASIGSRIEAAKRIIEELTL